MKLMRKFLIGFVFTITSNAFGLDLDWSGQFRTEANVLYQYSLDTSNKNADSVRFDTTTGSSRGGYYIPGGGSRTAYFQSLFLKLRPSLIVNDNISIKSEWWVGDPIYGFFGSGAPYPAGQRFYNSTSSRGSTIMASRLWGEYLSDFGTVQVGRVPLHWGLGVVWNNGDGLWDKYASTGDSIRVISKFGAFSVIPAYIKYSLGNSIGGSCPTITGGVCISGTGTSDVTDYSFGFKYENIDDDLEMGVNLVRRMSGNQQSTTGGYFGVEGIPVGMDYVTWDIYGKKTLGKFDFGIEVPIVTGSLGAMQYRTYAVALETKWKMSEDWETSLKAGHAQGQPNEIAGTGSPNMYRAFYFHPNYRLGLIMFHYNLVGISGPNTLNDSTTSASNLKSPYDNPITNTTYANWNLSYRTQKWTFRSSFIWARAHQVAEGGKKIFNSWERKFYTAPSGISKQGNNLGWEGDFGSTFHWDENFRFDLDFGAFFPGSFYRYSNVTKENAIAPLWAIVAKAGVSF
jgi:hypothetical protein